MSDIELKKFVEIIINKTFKSVDDVDEQIFESTGLTDVDDMVDSCTSKIMSILTEQQKLELNQDSLELIDLFYIQKNAVSKIDVDFASNGINNFILEMFNKLVIILKDHNDK